VFDEMFARKYFPKMERNPSGLDRDGSYNIKVVIMG
jgi:hypothetical protein